MLIIAEWLLISYVSYFAAIGLEWLEIYIDATSKATLANMIIFSTFIVIINLSLGLYETKLRESFRAIVRRITVSVIMSFFSVTIITGILLKQYATHPIYAPTAVTLIIISLIMFRYYVHTTNALVKKPKVVFLGAGLRASIIEKRMRRDVDRTNFNLLGFIATSIDDRVDGIKKEKVITIDIQKELVSFLVDNDVSEVIIACDQRRGVLPTALLLEARLKGVKITELLDFIERESGQIAVDLMYPSWLIFSSGFHTQNYIREFADYAVNVVIALLILGLTWPVMMITALVIYFDDGRRTGASVFYAQQRVGLNGQTFNILKFRSMRPDAEKDGAKWAQKGDSRVTSIGGFIRKYRIDELPQLLNVIKGEMSFIGPRPERPEFVEELEKVVPYYSQRHNCKPGLTGWAQLNYPYGASVQDSLEKLKYDLYYVKHQSFLLDVLILIRTVELVVFGKGR